STLKLGSSTDVWSNQGTIAATSSTVSLGGSFTLATMGIFQRSGGTVNLTGTLDNTGTTLVLDATTGAWNLTSGTLKRGAVATLDGIALTSASGRGTLDGVTLGGTVAGQAQPGMVDAVTGTLMVISGMTLANGTVVRVGDASHTGEIDLVGDETVG